MIQMMNNLCNNNATYIKIQNGGGFFADGDLWYTLNGLWYHGYTGIIPLGFSGILNLPWDAKNIKLKIMVWIYMRNQTMYNGPVRTTDPTCFFLYRSIYNPVITQIPCN